MCDEGHTDIVCFHVWELDRGRQHSSPGGRGKVMCGRERERVEIESIACVSHGDLTT